jgi:hypothetical protein
MRAHIQSLRGSWRRQRKGAKQNQSKVVEI